MGEAKTRKGKEKHYGRYPKLGRGVIISNPVEINNDGSLYLKNSELNPEELRRCILFWDEIVWPDNNIISMGGDHADTDYLNSVGIFSRPKVSVKRARPISAAEALKEVYVGKFLELESEQPGRWCISEGPESIVWEQSEMREGRGTLATFHRAIPLPDAEIPLEDLLEFKMRRKDEIVALKIALDGFYGDFLAAVDSDLEARRCLNEIDLRCRDAIEVAKESKPKFRISDVKLNFSMSVGGIASAGAFASTGALVGEKFGLAAVGAILGGSMPFITLTKSASISSLRPSENPFRFVGSLHNEVI